MLNQFISLFTALQMLLSGALTPEAQLELLFRSGIMLRLHVVAQDDTAEMQRIKLCVRDAVRTCYAANCPDENATMLQNTRAILPLLHQAALESARAEGFEGAVETELETFYFDALPLAESTVPAGEYPALIIRLGEARGHNWWGLIDPEASLRMAGIPDDIAPDESIAWDWSWRGFWQALRNLLPARVKEVATNALHP